MNPLASIKQGLIEAIDHAAGRESQAVVHPPRTIDVKAIREQVEMTQTAFAAAFGISLSTLRHWERGDRTPKLDFIQSRWQEAGILRTVDGIRSSTA